MSTAETRAALVQIGLGDPKTRAVAMLGVTGLVLYAAKFPHLCFDDDGKMKPFKPLAHDPEGTYVHFLALPIALATATYLFV